MSTKRRRSSRLHLNLPEIGPINSDVLGVWSVLTISGHSAPVFWKVRPLLVNFLRLTDHAVHSYKLSRQAYIDGYTHKVIHPSQWTDRAHYEAARRSFGATSRAISHVEVSVTSAHRALCFLLDAAKQDRELRKLLRGRAIRKAAVCNKLRHLRNAIQHLDERVRQNRLSGPISPLIAGGYLCIGEHRIRPTTLVGWLREMQTTAVDVVKHVQQASNQGATV